MPTVLTYSQAYREGVAEEMAANEKIFIMGTDIVLRGGHFAQVFGLGEQFGASRVRDVPISEAAMLAAGVGSAVCGMRPIVDLNFLDFSFGGMDEICNQAAKMSYMFGIQVPIADPRHERHRVGWRAAQQRDRVVVRRDARPQRRDAVEPGRHQGPDQVGVAHE